MSTDKLQNITVDEVKAYHGIAAADTDRDARIAVMMPLVIDWIINYCRNDFEVKARANEKPYIERFSQFFFTLYRPVTAVSSLTQDGVALTEDEDFYIDLDTGRIEKLTTSEIFGNAGRTSYWTTERNQIIISYTGGENLADAQDVVIIFYELVGILAGLKVRTFIDNEGIEQSVTLRTVPPDYLLILDRHKNIRLE